MLQRNPDYRPTLTEIFSHPWVCLPTPSKQEINQEFDRRRNQTKILIYEQVTQKINYFQKNQNIKQDEDVYMGSIESDSENS